ncbi:hypothetical protein B0H19DRAFT_1084956 [Mycena capillaripes]|nr:hypothetical protein B0H19DRAFT_1084956 [Mycena capillaripes]
MRAVWKAPALGWTRPAPSYPPRRTLVAAEGCAAELLKRALRFQLDPPDRLSMHILSQYLNVLMQRLGERWVDGPVDQVQSVCKSAHPAHQGVHDELTIAERQTVLSEPVGKEKGSVPVAAVVMLNAKKARHLCQLQQKYNARQGIRVAQARINFPYSSIPAPKYADCRRYLIYGSLESFGALASLSNIGPDFIASPIFTQTFFHAALEQNRRNTRTSVYNNRLLWKQGIVARMGLRFPFAHAASAFSPGHIALSASTASVLTSVTCTTFGRAWIAPLPVVLIRAAIHPYNPHLRPAPNVFIHFDDDGKGSPYRQTFESLLSVFCEGYIFVIRRTAHVCSLKVYFDSNSPLEFQASFKCVRRRSPFVRKPNISGTSNIGQFLFAPDPSHPHHPASREDAQPKQKKMDRHHDARVPTLSIQTQAGLNAPPPALSSSLSGAFDSRNCASNFVQRIRAIIRRRLAPHFVACLMHVLSNFLPHPPLSILFLHICVHRCVPLESVYGRKRAVVRLEAMSQFHVEKRGGVHLLNPLTAPGRRLLPLFLVAFVTFSDEKARKGNLSRC